MSDNPFILIKSRSLIFWFLLSLPILFLFSFISALILSFYHFPLENLIQDDPLIFPIISQIWIYGLIMFWCWRQKKRSGLNFKSLIGTLPPIERWIYLLLIIIPVLLFSLGCGQLTYYFLSFFAPSLVQSLLEQKLFFTTSDTQFPLLGNLLQFISLVILAPILEEILFRGFLFQRWATKWTTSKSLILSSLFFGLLHLNPIGLLIFGIVMGVLYIKTRTLLVPIIAHSLNNLAAVILELISSFFKNSESVYTLEQIHSLWWTGIGYIILATPLLVFFLYKNWPRKKQIIPYLLNSRQ